MRRRTFRTAATLSLAILFAAFTAIAQGSEHIKVKVPFEFVAAEKTMPPGEYTVAFGVADHAILIRSTDNKHALYVLTMDVQSSRIQENAKLVFHGYGDRYFLSEVWPAATQAGCLLHQSAAERALARTAKKTGTEIAVTGSRNGKANE